jgi:hypothetical protein
MKIGTHPLRFDRHEWAGSFGDIGTDLPLLIGMIAAAGLDSASVFILFGLMQTGTGLVYGLPMPMQPLKAMAVLVITGRIAGDTLFGAGFVIGLMMLILTATGLLTVLARGIPKCVVRGIQFGLGLSLASLALTSYVPSGGTEGWLLAAFALVVMLALWRNRRLPAGLVVVALGLICAVVRSLDASAIAAGFGLAWPRFHAPSVDGMLTGLVVLALPQLPLSLSNSVIATSQTCKDLFPERNISVRKIGFTYSLINIVMPFFGGIPVCHGCGGLAGHYAFGARTGGSVMIYGAMYLIVGLCFSRVFQEILQVFPRAILGVVLLFEALALMLFLRDQLASLRDTIIALLVALIAFLVPQGYVVGLIVGTAIYYAPRWFPLEPRGRAPGEDRTP